MDTDKSAALSVVSDIATQPRQLSNNEAGIIIDDKTPHLGLPLPSPYNYLEVDVYRLRDSFSGIDRALGAVGSALIGVNAELAQKANAADVAAITPADIGAVATSDPRLTDVRTPTMHKATHKIGGADVITPADIGAATASHTHTAQTSVTGNAATATKLQTARTIALTGGVTGSVNFDGSGNVNLATTVANLDAAKITSGTLPVARGGTGRTDGRAVALATARTISLAGDVTGSVNFDGTGNVSISATVGSAVKVSLAERFFFGNF